VRSRAAPRARFNGIETSAQQCRRSAKPFASLVPVRRLVRRSLGEEGSLHPEEALVSYKRKRKSTGAKPVPGSAPSSSNSSPRRQSSMQLNDPGRGSRGESEVANRQAEANGRPPLLRGYSANPAPRPAIGKARRRIQRLTRDRTTRKPPLRSRQNLILEDLARREFLTTVQDWRNHH